MVYWYGVEGDYNILIMSILGPNLQQLFEYCGKSFSLKTVLVIGIHLLQRIQSLHSKHFLHRDLKPENILIG
jgi:serine/threonine protein kinase